MSLPTRMREQEPVLRGRSVPTLTLAEYGHVTLVGPVRQRQSREKGEGRSEDHPGLQQPGQE